MIGSEQQDSAQSKRHGRASPLAMCGTVIALAFAASFVAVALASSTSATVDSASNAKLGELVVVTPRGRTLYTLSGETASHLKCKTKECLKFWPPLTVPSKKTKLKAGPGVRGRLRVLRRSNGVLQVTVRGMPVYRFFKDRAKGEVNGEGIESFGGTWHALAAGGEAKPVPAPAPTPTTPEPMPYTSTQSTPTPTAPTTPTTPTAPTTPTTPSPPPYGY
jgi:predicted lipoprotein with Yx(FWY)xxD motif